MDVFKILQELREERERVEEAIVSLEHLALHRGRKRRGRPPKWMAEAKKKRAAGSSSKHGWQQKAA